MQLDIMALIQVVVLALVALALGLFVVRPILATRPQPAPAALAPPASEAAGLPLAQISTEAEPGRPDARPDARPGARPDARFESRPEALTGEIEDPAAPVPQMAVVGGAPDAPGLPAAADPETDPVQRLRALIEDRREESVEILRSWLEDEEEKA